MKQFKAALLTCLDVGLLIEVCCVPRCRFEDIHILADHLVYRDEFQQLAVDLKRADVDCAL